MIEICVDLPTLARKFVRTFGKVQKFLCFVFVYISANRATPALSHFRSIRNQVNPVKKDFKDIKKNSFLVSSCSGLN